VKSDPLMDLMAKQEPDIERGCFFVPLDLYHRVNSWFVQKSTAMRTCQELMNARVPHILAMGYWVVPEQHRDAAIVALGGWRSPLV